MRRRLQNWTVLSSRWEYVYKVEQYTVILLTRTRLQNWTVYQ